MHEHFDVDGNPTGTTVITRETEWDDDTRARVLEATAYEDMLCRCGCGLPIDQAHVKQPFLVHDSICYASRALETKRRADAEAAKKAGKPDGWDDGLMYFVTLPEDQEVNRG